MSMFQQIAKAATMGVIAVLLTAPVAVAEQGGRYWVPKTTSPGPYWRPLTANPAPYSESTTTTPGPILGTDNDQPSPIFSIDQVRQAWPMACEKLDETVRHHAGAEAIHSCCDGPGRPRFQNAPFDPAGQYE